MDPILILYCTECPERTSLHGHGASSSQGGTLGLGCPLGMLLLGIQEWKISGEEGALTWQDSCWVLWSPCAVQ